MGCVLLAQLVSDEQPDSESLGESTQPLSCASHRPCRCADHPSERTTMLSSRNPPPAAGAFHARDTDTSCSLISSAGTLLLQSFSLRAPTLCAKLQQQCARVRGVQKVHPEAVCRFVDKGCAAVH